MKRTESLTELRVLKPAELIKRLEETRIKLAQARLDHGFGKTSQVTKLRQLKIELARLLTLIAEAAQTQTKEN